MITKISRTTDSDRTPDGLPKGMEPESEWPGNWASVNGGPGTQPINAKFEQRNTKNDSLPYLIGASVAAAIALTLCLIGYIYGPAFIEAKLRAQFAQDIAEAKAEARTAATDAAIAKNTAQKLEARLNERR